MLKPTTFAAALLLAGSANTPAAPITAQPIAFDTEGHTLTVRAFIDGVSVLNIVGGDLYWQQLQWAAPGRWSQPIDSPLPTYVNAFAWYPDWPSPGENRCSGCLSSVGLDLAPPLLEIDQLVTLSVVQARGSVRVLNQPSADDGWRLSVLFDDGPPGGAAWYEVALDYAVAVEPEPEPEPDPEPIPAPGTALLLLAGLAGLGGARRLRVLA